METSIQTQVSAAFDARPGLDGTIHGTRKIKQGKHGSRSSLFYSAKNQAFVPVESRLERTYCYLLEAEPTVIKYRTQALEIPYRKHALYPDFLVQREHDRIQVREVKCSVFAESSRNLEKFHFLGHALGQLGLDFDVVTEGHMLKGQQLLNLMMVYDRGGRLTLPEHMPGWLAELVQMLDPINRTVEVLRKELAKHGLPAYYLEAAIFHGQLICDMRRPIIGTTLVRLPS